VRIILLSHTGSVTGGAEQCLLEYVDLLTSKGHKCKVIVPVKGNMTRVLSAKGIDYVVIGYGWAVRPHRKVNPHRIMASTGNSLARIFQEVEKYKPDIIMTNTSVIPWGLYAGKAFNIPTVLLVHEIISDKDPSLDMIPSYEEYGDILNKNTDYVIYNSQFVKKEFENVLTLPKTSTNILYPLPPLNLDKINKFFKHNIIQKKLKIAIFGSLSPRKNQLEALSAAKILKSKGITNFTIDLYGDKKANIPYTKSLRKFITENNLKENVKIKGFTNEIYETMNEYNVVLSTSTYEPFGRSIIEGQLFGRIVIANNTGGGVELVDDMKTGMIYKLGNPESLADVFSWIIEHKDQSVELGNNAMQKQFSKYITESRYEALLDAVEYLRGNKILAPYDIFNPVLGLYHYNHQLNHRYRHLHRLTHNKVTHRVKISVNNITKKVKELKQGV
jgi:glycosyltransferase involved in cell wall biosynthesis